MSASNVTSKRQTQSCKLVKFPLSDLTTKLWGLDELLG